MTSNIEILNLIIERAISKINTTLPAKIVKYDFTKQKASVQPLINYVSQEGEEVELPIINNVPVKMPRSGGAIIKLPVNVGDYVELSFHQRSLEEWLRDGKQSTPDDPRTYDLTDATATIGLNPFSETSPASNNEDVEVIYAGSSIVIKKNGDINIKGGNINVEATNATIKADSATIDSSDIKLGDGAVQGVARLGDEVVVGGITGTITQASSITKSL